MKKSNIVAFEYSNFHDAHFAAQRYDKKMDDIYIPQITNFIWAALCFVLFVDTGLCVLPIDCASN